MSEMRKLSNWELDNYKNNMTNIPRGTLQDEQCNMCSTSQAYRKIQQTVL